MLSPVRNALGATTALPFTCVMLPPASTVRASESWTFPNSTATSLMRLRVPPVASMDPLKEWGVLFSVMVSPLKTVFPVTVTMPGK